MADSIQICLADSQLGHNVELEHGFFLGTTPDGYGVKWSRGSDGLGTLRYWFAWETPNDPVRIVFENQEYLFLVETASDAEIVDADTIEFEQKMNVR